MTQTVEPQDNLDINAAPIANGTAFAGFVEAFEQAQDAIVQYYRNPDPSKYIASMLYRARDTAAVKLARAATNAFYAGLPADTVVEIPVARPTVTKRSNKVE